MDGLAGHWVVAEALKLSTFLVLMLKLHFKRSRPHQVAPIVELVTSPLLAFSARHPAFPSGHAIQTFFFAAALLEVALEKHSMSGRAEPLSEAFAPGISAIALGIADRRIVAGVHYPSDNYASAAVFEMMAPSLFPMAPGCIAWQQIQDDGGRPCAGELEVTPPWGERALVEDGV